MRVRELIARLKELDPELPVVMPADDGMEFCRVEAAFLDIVVVINGEMSLGDERDEGHERAVRLFGPETDFTAIPPLDD